LRWLAALALLAIAFGCAQGDEEPAVAAVDAWLAIVDSGELGLAWDRSSSTFRNELAKEAFETSIRDSRAPLGSFVSRKVRSAQAARSLPGAPRGRYVVIHYDSQFENQKSAVESLTAVYEEDEWRVLGYRSR
jgi:serine/threonine-protein kinase